MASPDPTTIEVPPWLKSLPLAPIYHPTPSEFQDPISYILKIEKEASCYGICKIVPPLPSLPRKTAFSNLNRSFSSSKGASFPTKRTSSTFTTRQQQIGFCPRRPRPVQKAVWESGEEYTLSQFEQKARAFERSHLRRCCRKSPGKLSEIEVETLFWKAASDKPIVVEYANDIPGSGFSPRMRSSLRKWKEEDAGDVGDTAWNMRGVSREKGSLLRFMKEEIPGVTSPMVYVAMMFSWFAWHVEDHELHSLNYLHMGAGKTWYGVPRDARFAFEEVVRVQGYGGEVNPLVTFALLGEKTTVMSPEVLLGAGIPCCRLVQNAGDFIVTFPGSYHCGFSHGYNCGEASNIATPQWLNVAKEAAVRRASINVPPMVSHFQLLFELAMSLWSRLPSSGALEPRSSRLKDKLRGEGEIIIKETFVKSIIENNKLLDTLLDKGSSCVVLSQNGFGVTFCSNSHSRTQMKTKAKPSLGSCNHGGAQEDSREAPSDEPMRDGNTPRGRRNCPASVETKHLESHPWSDSQNAHREKENALHTEGLLDQGLLSCVTCGILSFACVAIVQPTEETAMYLLSANCSTFIDESVDTSETCPGNNGASLKNGYEQAAPTGGHSNNRVAIFDDAHDHQVETSNLDPEPDFPEIVRDGPSALDLLASAYGDLSSDADEEDDACEDKLHFDTVRDSATLGHVSSKLILGHRSDNTSNGLGEQDMGMSWDYSSRNHAKHDGLMESQQPLGDNLAEASPAQSSCDDWIGDDADHDQINGGTERLKSMSAGPSASQDSHYRSKVMPSEHTCLMEEHSNSDAHAKKSAATPVVRPDKDSSRMHVFCLEHAVEVERQLSRFGGVNIMLLCHPDYPTMESQARSASEELGISCAWKGINFREASEEDQERIQTALEDEEVIPTNSDWAVKMGINLYYSASLRESPLYNKQMPYNRVIYKAFGRNQSGSSPGKLKVFERRRGKKSVVAGRWCGKVWMSNQAHPYIVRKNDAEEQDDADKFKPKQENVLEREVNDDDDDDDAKVVKVPPRNSSDVDGPYTRTSSRKRKKPPERSGAKKPRYTWQDGNESPDSTTRNSPGRSKRIRRNARKIGTCTTPRDQDEEEDVEVPRPHGSSLEDHLGSGPTTRMRSRPSSKGAKAKKPATEKQMTKKKGKQPISNGGNGSEEDDDDDQEGEYNCNVEGCTMSFSSKQDLALHKRNICPVKGCGKKFFSHKYLVQHRRVHVDDRPLKCPWKGCKMTFKWAWARTEHIRVHTGDRPYICMVGGCGQTFRFVSDFSRHKRKTGHVCKKGRR